MLIFDEELLTELMTAILNGTYDNDEALKLKVFNAISIEEDFYQQFGPDINVGSKLLIRKHPDKSIL